ncbi:2-C-methyl-D-erythritol 4-phosphate cytidylyltransferase, partial [Hominenteromicrobium sp.]|uniref:2-C-methyl-D-erythritol 4-phosphate cytidylyltransferase n=2 Tax=Hominenteromicrobium sp. TaxID=3073581 RepID=UPI003AEF2839
FEYLKNKVGNVMKTAAILVAAGSSARMKSGGASKTMMKIGGEPVLSRTLRAFENTACISKIVIVARACDFDAIQKASAFVTKPLTITEGGKERQDSVSNGAALCGDAEYIAVHDAARPFITPEEIETVCADAEKYGAATLAVPVKDTIKVAAADGTVCATPERSTLRAIQTPQVFRLSLYKEALCLAKNAGKQYTDDCQLIEAAGGKVYLTPGDYKNIKITTPEDLLVAEAFAAEK